MVKNYIKLEVWEWSEWVEDIVNRLKGELKYDITGDPVAEVTVEELLYAPKLDPENIEPFCKYHMFNNIYENKILVRHFNDKDCLWFINSDHTSLIYKPKQVNNE